MHTPYVELKGISKSYHQDGSNQIALKDINVKIDKGDYISIVGRSGSGKSTLLNILGLLDKPSAGHYLLLGNSIDNLSANEIADLRKSVIGFVFQSFNLLKNFSILENVALPAIYAGLSRSEAAKRALDVLSLVNMQDFSKRYPAQLSGGQQQRCAIARALINRPSLLLADEPTGNLDSENADSIVELLEALNTQEGVTLVMVTHELQLASRSRKKIVVQDGVAHSH